MKKHLLPTTIRGKIIAYTGTITLLIVAVTVAICFQVFQAFSRRNQIQSAEYNLQVVSHNVAANMGNILSFNEWCHLSPDIYQYLDAFKDLNRMPSISSENAPLRTTALNTYTRLKEEYNNTPSSSNYVVRVIISPINCRNYLQLCDTAAAITPDITEMIQREPFFTPLFEAADYQWVGLIRPYYPTSDATKLIPVIRPVYSQYSSEIVGWTYLAISDRVIRDYLSAFPLQSDAYLYITIGDKQYLYQDGAFEETAISHNVLSDIGGNAINANTTASLIRTPDGSKRRLVTCPLGNNGWTISAALSESDYNAQNRVYLLIITGIVAAIVLMGLILAWLLTRTISQPVLRLRSRIECISQGDFSRDQTIEGADELGIIGRGINDMSENVQTLLERKVEDEKQKKDLEYQILQSQINPHFLYNTLNSIKWMATIQNASGIAEMVTALARLMKNVSKGTTAQIPLREELALVKDYVLIQQYRYGGSLTVEYNIASNELERCLIHRFTLQPLLENALFHGIEPKGCAGKIQIRAEKLTTESLGEVLQVSVTDNGIGMSEETIRQVLAGTSAPTADFFRQLGINNVNKRIQYEFGKGYGLSIRSEPGEYTTMTITLPYRLSEGEEL